MAIVDINWNPSHRELRVFSLLLIGFGAVVATLLLARFDRQTPALATLLGTTFLGLLGVALPALLRPLYVLWMGLAFPIGWTVSHVLMVVVFYLVLTPIGLIMRLCGHDPLRRGFDREASSYWLRRSPRNDATSYFRQY